MKLTILSVAYPFAPVGLDSCGGAEQIVALLDAALTREGCHSVVIGCEGSRVLGTLAVASKPHGQLSEQAQRDAHVGYRLAIQRAIQDCQPDIIHMHGVDFHAYLPNADVPVLATLHLPPSWYPSKIFRAQPRNLHLRCVSHSQRRACPGHGIGIPVIENGVGVERFSMRSKKHNFILGLGRICPEKAFHIALDAADQAGLSMFLAGAVFPYPKHERYFQLEILPRLGPNKRFLGPVGFVRKRRLLASARAVVIPSLAPETSSLVAMEALAAGTPVVAFGAGALSDIVEHGKTGFLVSTKDEMAQALQKAHLLSPEVCRARARERFSASRMLAQYRALYRKLTRRANWTVFQPAIVGSDPARVTR